MNLLLFFSAFLVFFLFLFLLVLFWKKQEWGFLGIVLFMALGELARIKLIPGIFEMPGLDLYIFFFAFIWLFIKIFQSKKPDFLLGKLYIPGICFLGVAGISLLLALPELSIREFLASLYYPLRFGAYFLLFFIALNSKITLLQSIFYLCILSLLLSIFGFIQIWLVPDFTELALWGWDPHMGRLLSTWFDPNYVGGFFAFVLIVILNLGFYIKNFTRFFQGLLILTGIITLLALYLTFSRSGYLMLFFGIFLTGIFRSPRLLFGLACMGVLFVLMLPRARERIFHVYDSAIAFVTNSYDYTLDETSKLRVESWTQGFEIFAANPWVGVGYNTLRFYKFNHGYILWEEHHAGSGTDSSFLTILATMGMVGFLTYAWLIFSVLHIFWKARVSSNILSHMGFGLFFATLALIFHSNFVNSLLLSYFLALLFIFSGIVDRENGNQKI